MNSSAHAPITDQGKTSQYIPDLNHPSIETWNTLLRIEAVSECYRIPISVLQSWIVNGALKLNRKFNDDRVAAKELMQFLRSEAAGEYRISVDGERQSTSIAPNIDTDSREKNGAVHQPPNPPVEHPGPDSTEPLKGAPDTQSLPRSELMAKSGDVTASKAKNKQRHLTKEKQASSPSDLGVDEEAQIPLGQIVFDGDTQVRERLNLNVIGQYASLMQQGTKFPSVDLFLDEAGKFYVGDGHHRLEAAKLCKKTEFHARIRKGGKAAAKAFALSANHGHGLRLTSRDKRKAIGMAFAVHPDWSNNQIATLCQVSEASVRKHRTSFVNVAAGKRLGADGKHYTTPVTESEATSKKISSRFNDTKYYVRNLPPEMRIKLIQWMGDRFPGDFQSIGINFPKKSAA